jgi:hypothetical protein
LADMKDAEQKHLPRLRQIPANASNLEIARLRADGQIWELCTSIGHNLNTSLRISGCSSQRPGINSSSDLVIATSSLEVGFDDPEVGAVVHHKRPSSMASFVQSGRSLSCLIMVPTVSRFTIRSNSSVRKLAHYFCRCGIRTF